MREINNGSSPQARGTLRPLYYCRTIRRFIPAGAGNTALLRRHGCINTVHPRRRGEHSGQENPASTSARFIPAGAGNTGYRRTGCRPRTVHPRRRGEHTVAVGALVVSPGSSPQARGTRLRSASAQISGRFIPAGAGNTLYPTSRAQQSTVHPRRRGEHPIHQSSSACTGGSSPQARGTLPVDIITTHVCRFIPAGAGNTITGIAVADLQPVHPRRRGEHANFPYKLFINSGSSPQARGTQMLPG